MAVDIQATRDITLAAGGDTDGDGVIDPGETVTGKISVTNAGTNNPADNAIGVIVTDSLTGLTLVPGSIEVTPIAFDDALPSVTGNTPITFTAAQLLGNDVDPDGAEVNLTITAVSNATNGTIVDNGNGTFTFTPTTGFEGTASFEYTVTDEQGLASVTTGVASFTVTDPVWYIDSTGGSDVTGDGSFANPFASLAPINTGGSADLGATGDDTGDTIFVYANGANAYNSGIVLEQGQTLRGEGVAADFVVNGMTISSVQTDTQIEYSTFGVELNSGNTILGIDFVGEAAVAVAIRDNGGTVGNLAISDTEVDGLGQIIDVDNGGALAVTFESVASNASSGVGGVIDLAGVTGTFTVTGATTLTTSGGTHNQAGIDIGGAGTNLTANFAGGTSLTMGTNASASGVNLTTNSGSVTFAGLDITTNSATALAGNAGGTLTITGSDNDIATATGQILNLNGMLIGAGDAAFDQLTVTGTATGNAIELNNVDGNDLTIANASIAGASADGINVSNGSSTNIAIATGSIAATTGNSIEINGSTGTFGFNGGTINNTGLNEGVLISGGTGAVNIGATVTKTGTGNVVEVQSHSSGTITFSNTISSIGTVDNGILINNSGGTIAFTGANSVLNTGNHTAVQLSNNTANVDFTGGGLDIDTLAGRGISAGTIGTSTGGTLTVSGSGNTITSTTGSAFVLHGTDSDGITFQSISKNGGTESAIYIKDAGTGGFTITGTGSTANSGGTIQNIADGGSDFGGTAGTGVYVENTSNIALNNMLIGNGTTLGNYGIYGLNVVNFTLRDSVLNGTSGDNSSGSLESAVFFDDLTGVGLFEGNNISGGFIDNMRIVNDAVGSSTLNLFVRDSANDAAIFGSNNTGNQANDSLNVQVYSNNNILMLVDGIQMTAWRGDGIQASAFESANLEVTVQNSTFFNTHTNIASGGGIGILIGGTAQGSSWGVDYTVQNNQTTGAKGVAIAASFNGYGGTARGIITGNTVGTPGNGTFDGSGSSEGSGIFVSTEYSGAGSGALTHYSTISNNTIRDVNDAGIFVRAASGDSLANNAVTEATITNNTVAQMGPATPAGGSGSFAALYMIAGGNDPDFSIMRADVTGNTLDISNTHTAYAPIFMDQIFATAAKYELPGHNGTDGDSATTDTYFTTTKSNVVVLDTTVPTQLDPGSAVFSPDAVINPGVLQPAQTGSNTQLPTGALFAAETPPPETEKTSDDPALEPEVVDEPETGGETGDAGSDTGPAPAEPAAVEDGVVSEAELTALVDAAIARWQAAGATDAQIAAMRAVEFGVADMLGVYLGTSSIGSILLDSDGGGHGWFVDATPGDDAEFANGTATADGGAAGKIDLLTVILHELGHQIGLDDSYNVGDAGELMYGYIGTGERHLPGAEEVGAASGEAVTGVYALTPVSIGTLPAGKTVDVYFEATVDALAPGVITNPQGTASVSGDNFVTVNVNSTIVLDSLTLGDVVFRDVDGDGVFDGGESGIDGVALTLFVDNGSVAGAFDATDTQVAITTTAGGGLYAFTGLAPGNYLVRVDAANFTGGGALVGRGTSPGGADPDDNVENDDNGVDGTGGIVVSQAITLSYNNEPTAGPGNDTNSTLDFGFLSIPVAQDDDVTTDEVTVSNGDVFADNGNGADSDPDNPLVVGAVNGSAANVDTQITLPSGALLTLNADGTFSYDPNGQFDYLVSAATGVATGAVNTSATDTFTYTLDGGNTATVTMTITGLDGPGSELHGDGNNNTLTGTPQVDVMRGFGGDDTITGLASGDFIVGGTGNDAMTGGLGDDTYYVDSLLDTITEAGGEGTDRVAAEASYVLAAGVSIEQLDARDLTGTAAIDLTGNEFAQTLIGNAGDNALDGAGAADYLIGYVGNDSLTGGAGNDILLGGPGDDAMDGGADNDVFYIEDAGDTLAEAVGEGFDRVATSIDYTLTAGAEIELFEAITLTDTTALDLTGNEFNNTIIGNAGVNTLRGEGGDDVLYSFTAADHLIGGAGNDILQGASGNDTMDGGLGDDTFYVDDAGDVLVEAAGEGYDRAATAVSYTLGVGASIELFEAVTLTATAALDLTGNAFGQSLVGNAGDNVLDGKGGTDVLYGHSGADTFAFTTALGPDNVDYLEDMASGTDTIALDDAVFAALGGLGALDAEAFATGPLGVATEADDRIVYDPVTGALYYDADGSGVGASAIQFAQLVGAPALAASDFVVI